MAKTLPAAEWTKRPALAALVAALGNGNARWVGGAVRDTLLGTPVSDIDCATPLLPEEVIARLKDAGIRSVPTGLAHGTVTALVEGGNVEITTLRHDVSTDGRRATVKFASEWKDDAARRDFTINALYADPDTLEVHDYFGGLADLEARTVRFIGDARERIREDHLRILRYFRFQARFGADLDEEAEKACSELAETLEALSRERVGWELLNLLGLPDPAPTINRTHELGVLQVVLPESGKRELVKLAELIEAERRTRTAPDGLRRLAALLPALPTIAISVGKRLRLSRQQCGRLGCAAERNDQDQADPRALAYRAGIECAVDRLLMAGADLSAFEGWDLPDFPLKGGAIVQHGIKPGPQVARILSEIEDQWIAEGFPDNLRVSAILESKLAQE
ncbi:CCA tRNA nucleotidyltransferase [Altererythrobacter sp. ZODW24]|uniref:CCA tRNA nucleotidyltransferase n=1 Tax=Altererythrobacter sp. ZODW24 TaxID=2185142 RepID=UPI000DF826C3|nr:CCA tRNA nucleotidyltransferase [Altererythrobacter sp. ZODW24]